MSARNVWLTDRWGAQVDDATAGRFAALLDALDTDADEEHGSVSITDSDEWNLEFYRDRVVFENLEEDRIGALRDASRATRLAVAREFLDGDLDAVRARDWS